jgi:hypothetical protein
VSASTHKGKIRGSVTAAPSLTLPRAAVVTLSGDVIVSESSQGKCQIATELLTTYFKDVNLSNSSEDF